MRKLSVNHRKMIVSNHKPLDLVLQAILSRAQLRKCSDLRGRLDLLSPSYDKVQKAWVVDFVPECLWRAPH